MNFLNQIKAFAVAGISLAAGSALASSHREAPLITEDPTVDSTDVYAFLSPDGPNPGAGARITLLANYIPFQEPAGGPNYFHFSDSAKYRINIDNTGDAVEDIVYEFDFNTTVANGGTFLYNTGNIAAPDSAAINRLQRYTVTRVNIAADGTETRTVILRDAPVAPQRIGPRSNGNQAAYEGVARAAIQAVGQGGATRVFVGPRDEGFYLDINAIFDLLNISRVDGLGDGTAVDGTAGFNVSTIGLEMPVRNLTADGSEPVLGNNLGGPNAVLGVWTSAERRKHRVLRRTTDPREFGPWVQVSRLGLPLINEVVVPLGFKDQFNRSHPSEDLSNIAGFVVDPELSRLLTAVHGVPTPPAPRNDMVAVISFLPGLATSRNDLQPADLLRINVAIPPTRNNANRLGVIGGDLAGFPNGRRVGDDVVDILERVVGGGILVGAPFNGFPNNALNDGVDSNDVPYLGTFPFLGTPHEGFVHDHVGNN
jgi:hypothetical protein